MSDTHPLAELADPEWSVVESVTEYETGWYTGGYDLVDQPDGSRKKYYWAELAPAVVIVAVTDDQLLFVEQYRPRGALVEQLRLAQKHRQHLDVVKGVVI